MKQRMLIKILCPVLLLAAFAANARWQINEEQSSLSFVSVKKGDVAEVGSFKKMSGRYDNAGDFVLKVQLSSVDSGLPIRDERIKSMLFNVEEYPAMTLSAHIDPSEVNNLAVGQLLHLEVPAQMQLHGKSGQLHLKLVVAKLDENRLLVTSQSMVIVNAANYGMIAGLDKLKELAGLSSISQAVPVTFVLLLER